MYGPAARYQHGGGGTQSEVHGCAHQGGARDGQHRSDHAECQRVGRPGPLSRGGLQGDHQYRGRVHAREAGTALRCPGARGARPGGGRPQGRRDLRGSRLHPRGADPAGARVPRRLLDLHPGQGDRGHPRHVLAHAGVRREPPPPEVLQQLPRRYAWTDDALTAS